MDINHFSLNIIKLCEKPNTALAAIHQILQKGQVSQHALMAIYQRVMADKDQDAAYYLAALAQKNDDLPFEVLPLILLVFHGDDNNAKLALWEKLPKSAKIILQEQGVCLENFNA